MFDIYDNTEKKYGIFYRKDNRFTTCTTQDLYEFYIFFNHGIEDSFETLLKRLEGGETIMGDQNEFDWNLGTELYLGKLEISKLSTAGFKILPVSSVKPKTCDHKNKYINIVSGIKFYVCPDCKADLGNV